MSAPSHVYRAYIAAPAAEVWRAIVDGDYTAQYFYGTRIASDFEPGSQLVYTNPDGSVAADGEIVAVDPGKRLEMTFVARWDLELEAEGPCREVWLVEETVGPTKLTVEVYDVAESDRRFGEYREGFPFIISGLKTLLETGKPMV